MSTRMSVDRRNKCSLLFREPDQFYCRMLALEEIISIDGYSRLCMNKFQPTTRMGPHQNLNVKSCNFPESSFKNSFNSFK